MKVFVCTPCYGGQLTTAYMLSFLQASSDLAREGITLALDMISNESLIQRARNRCAADFMKSGFDKLLFIDSDIQFTPDDVRKIIMSDKKIICGLYPVKAYPLNMNFNVIEEHAKYFPKGWKNAEEYRRYMDECSSLKGEIEVRHAATGFMCIDRTVLEELINLVPHYEFPDYTTQTIETHYDLFFAGYNPETKNYDSEDWGFCELAGRYGFKIFVNSTVLLGHYGAHLFMPGQEFISEKFNV